jgi:threonyl-tRNA synthetase
MIKLSQLERTKIKPSTREEHIERIEAWKKAQEALENICADLGIEVPVMVC